MDVHTYRMSPANADVDKGRRMLMAGIPEARFKNGLFGLRKDP
jgi:hypothetical protein